MFSMPHAEFHNDNNRYICSSDPVMTTFFELLLTSSTLKKYNIIRVSSNIKSFNVTFLDKTMNNLFGMLEYYMLLFVSNTFISKARLK